MGREQTDFAEFYEANWEPCLRAVLPSMSDQRLAEDLVAEAFTKAWASPPDSDGKLDASPVKDWARSPRVETMRRWSRLASVVHIG